MTLEEYNDDVGVNLFEARPQTNIIVTTKNSTYSLVVVDKTSVLVQGGTLQYGVGYRYPFPMPVTIFGSIITNTQRRAGWILFGSKLEWIEPNRPWVPVTTTRIVGIQVANRVLRLQRANWIKEGF